MGYFMNFCRKTENYSRRSKETKQKDENTQGKGRAIKKSCLLSSSVIVRIVNRWFVRTVLFGS